MRNESIDQRLLGPVTDAALGLGLRVDEPEVLGFGANVVIHLRPSPVVARVATLTAEMRGNPSDYLRRERDVTTALSNLGVDVIAPTTLVDPGPHHVAGHWFLLMDHRELTPIDLTSADHAVAVGRSLVNLEEAMADLIDLDRGDRGHPWAEVDTLLATVRPTTDPEAMARIERAVASLQATEPEDPWRPVHGDAHRVNVAFDGDRVVWFDFEDSNDRPLNWDLATPRRAWPAAGDVACRQLGVDPSSFSMRWHHELREVYALLWNLLYARRFEHTRRATEERLDDWLDQDALATLLAGTNHGERPADGLSPAPRSER